MHAQHKRWYCTDEPFLMIFCSLQNKSCSSCECGKIPDIIANTHNIFWTHRIFWKKNGNTIKLRFAADGRRTNKKIGTVMAVFSLIDEQKHSPEYQYTMALYNGKYS